MKGEEEGVEEEMGEELGVVLLHGVDIFKGDTPYPVFWAEKVS